MKTGIVIIHYNDLESLNNLINNIKDYKVLDKIIIYDNNSRDDIKKELKKYNKNNIEVIFNDSNKGYSYAINEASKYLIKELGKCHIIISNSDVIINKEEDIINLIKLLKDDIGVVAPTIVENDKLNRGWKNPSPFIDSLMNYVGIHRLIRKKYVFYKDSYYKDSFSYVDVVSGCFFIINSDTFESINYLDDRMFLYYEENVLSKKIKSINKRIVVSNDILIIHNHSISINKNIDRIKKLKIQKESQYYYHVHYNNIGPIMKLILKGSAFINRQVLKIYYKIKG